jgi:hypothetical protein
MYMQYGETYSNYDDFDYCDYPDSLPDVVPVDKEYLDKIDPAFRKIDAIKELRTWAEKTITCGCGLKEAKDFLELLCAREAKDKLVNTQNANDKLLRRLRDSIQTAGLSYAEYMSVKDQIVSL